MVNRKEFRRRRVEFAVSQEELAKIAGVSYRTIVRAEKGEKIRESSLKKISRALEILKSRGKEESLWWLSHKDTMMKKIQKVD